MLFFLLAMLSPAVDPARDCGNERPNQPMQSAAGVGFCGLISVIRQFFVNIPCSPAYTAAPLPRAKRRKPEASSRVLTSCKLVSRTHRVPVAASGRYHCRQSLAGRLPVQTVVLAAPWGGTRRCRATSACWRGAPTKTVPRRVTSPPTRRIQRPDAATHTLATGLTWPGAPGRPLTCAPSTRPTAPARVHRGAASRTDAVAPMPGKVDAPQSSCLRET